MTWDIEDRVKKLQEFTAFSFNHRNILLRLTFGSKHFHVLKGTARKSGRVGVLPYSHNY
jgi:hypothetical protein